MWTVLKSCGSVQFIKVTTRDSCEWVTVAGIKTITEVPDIHLHFLGHYVARCLNIFLIFKNITNTNFLHCFSFTPKWRLFIKLIKLFFSFHFISSAYLVYHSLRILKYDNIRMNLYISSSVVGRNGFRFMFGKDHFYLRVSPKKKHHLFQLYLHIWYWVYVYMMSVVWWKCSSLNWGQTTFFWVCLLKMSDFNKFEGREEGVLRKMSFINWIVI